MRFSSKKKKYLIIGGIVLLGVLIYFLSDYFGTTKYTQTLPEGEKVALKTLVGRDSNTNGIPDWEEALWGLDPYADGATNKNTIIAKKAAQGIPTSTNTSTEAENLNETQTFARDILSTVASLQASGGFTSENLNNISTKVGESVGTNTTLDDKYSIANLSIIKNESKADVQTYYSKWSALSKKYIAKDIGKETQIISVAVNTENGAGISDLKKISDAYFAYAAELSTLKIPASAGIVHTTLINDLANVGVATRNIADLYSNSLIGVIGLSQYQKYSTELLTDLTSLQTYFRQNGILK